MSSPKRSVARRPEAWDDQMIREREQSIRALFEESPAGILRVELDHTISDANRRACEILGYAREELLGRTTLSITHPEDRGIAMEQVDAVNTGRARRLAITKRYIRSDGKPIPVSLTSRGVHGADGRIAFRLTMVEDLTALAEAEYGRLAESQRFRLVVEAAPNAMIVVNRSGEMTLVNTQAERLFGYTREELLGQQVEMLLPKRLRNAHSHHRQGFAAAPQPRAMGAGRDLYGLRKDGTEVPIEIGLHPMQTAQGEQVLASIIDITERKRAETERSRYTAELQRSNRDLDQFAYVASHDLKAPLRAIQNLASWIAKDAAAVLPPSSARHLQLLISRTHRLEKLLDDLLKYSRAGRMLGELDKVDMNEVVHEVIEMLAPRPGIAIRVQEAMPTVLTYRAPMRELLLNLVGNAVKHHDREIGEIEVKCVRIRGSIVVTISDDGPGIPLEHRERVFGMFQTLKPRDDVEGSGMGLAFVKKLVETQGGKVEIVDSGCERGTKICFSWPIGDL